MAKDLLLVMDKSQLLVRTSLAFLDSTLAHFRHDTTFVDNHRILNLFASELLIFKGDPFPITDRVIFSE
jgi:hypothetical protein